MYDDIYSLYGPLYNGVYGLVFVVLHVPLTHTTGRLIAAALWLTYTAGFAVFCQRLTSSMAVMLFGYVLVLIWLAELMESPGHPEELCLLLLAAVLLLACSIERAAGAANLAGVGAAVAALALVKINVGVYVGGGLVLVLLRVTAPTAWTRIAIPILTITLLLLPFAVEALLFDFRWARLYSLFSALSIAAALFGFVNTPPQGILRAADWRFIALGAGLTCLIVIGGMMLAGSSAYAILNATLLQNTHFIRNWNIPLSVGRKGLLAAAASVLASLAYRASGSWSRMQCYCDIGVVTLKSGFVLLGVSMLLFASPEQVFQILVPFCWLLVVQPAGIRPQHAVGRGVAGLIGAILSLYPFPVAGHQIRIGTLLPVMIVPILAHDLLKASPERKVGRHLRALFHSSPVAVAVVLAIGAVATLRSARAYLHGEPLGLPGTSLIRVPASRADDLRWVAAQLSACPSSYTVPGMWSFTLWAHHALPTALNINDVLAFIQAPQQEEIVRTLSRLPNLCVVYNPRLLQFFDRGQIETDPPLLHYVETRLVPVARHHDYIILKQPASTAQPGAD